MKRILSFLFSIVLVSVSISEVCSTNISVSGTISTNTTWSVDTVNVTGDIIVANGVTLNISPKTTIIVQGTFKLDIKGCLKAIGTVTDSIVFTAVNKVNGWRGIRFNSVSVSNATSFIHYCRIEYAKASGGYPENAGGAIGLFNYSGVDIRNCLIAYNSATYGGGIACENNSSPTIINNYICNNMANGEAGGVNCYSSSPVLIGNVIVNNHNNGVNGGGVYFFSSSSKAANNTIANNSAKSGAGVMFGNNSNVVFINNIVWGNSTLGSSNNIHMSATNTGLSITFCNIQGGQAGISGVAFGGTYQNNLMVDPLFFAPTLTPGYVENAVFADFSLSNASPCRNAGSIDTSNLSLPEYDISQLIRIRNTRIEIGAYEWCQIAFGNITGNETWNDMIRVKLLTTVTATGFLTINAGTTIEFTRGTNLIVHGRVLAVGNQENKIRFKPVTPAVNWKGIRFTSTVYPTDSSKFEHCILTGSWADGALTADKQGGAFYIYYASKLLIRNCIISNNRATTLGGGIYVSTASPSIINNLIVNNTASSGGGIYVTGTSSPLIVNNTVAYNSSHGIYHASGTAAITSNIVYGNGSNPGFFGSPAVTYNCLQSANAGAGNITSNPQFKNPPAGTGISFNGLTADFDINASSPCINAGNPNSSSFHLPSYELSGKQRLLSTVDMGCYEYVSSMNACGIISANTTWNTNYVNVTCDITINSGVTLTINPGTVVEFQGNYKITVNGGTIRAIGSSADSIYFRANNPTTGWGGIRFASNSSDSSIFELCSFTNGKIVAYSGSHNNMMAVLTLQYCSRFRIDKCSFFGNSTTQGNITTQAGALYLYVSYALVKNSQFSGNSSQHFGGAIGVQGGAPLITNCRIHSNQAGYGSIYITGTPAKVIGCVISNNTASVYGGGVYLSGGTPEIISNLIVNNQAPRGGGIYSTSNNTPILVNNTIARNKATISGGGIFLATNSDMEIFSCILSGNEATTSGNQVYLNDIASDPKIYSSFVQGGTADFAGPGAGIEYQGVYIGNIDLSDPLFVSPASLSGTAGNGLTADYRLQNSSPCINTGFENVADQNLPEFDLDGNPRIFNGIVDMGAYENQAQVSFCGTITNVVKWLADTILISCDVYINDPAASLTIKPGAVVKFMGPYRIMVQRGNVLAIGTTQKPITFTVNDTTGFSDISGYNGGWSGLWLSATNQLSDSSIFEHCNFYYGKAASSSPGNRRGGALYIYNFSKVRISNCKFINNRAQEYGGAIFCESANPIITNSLFAHNSVAGSGNTFGGAIEFRDAAPIVMNNTFAYNTATYGGALRISTGSGTYRNNIFWGNTALNSFYLNFYVSGGSNSGQNNIIETGTSSLGGWSAALHTGIINSNPLFKNPLANPGYHPDAFLTDYAPEGNSPAVNAGSNTNASVLGLYDLKGLNRLVAGTLDIGAFEVQMSPKFITAQPSNVSVCVGLPASFNVTSVIDANYQWQKNGVNISGASSASLSIPITTLLDSGNYVCVISNEFGSISSDTAHIDLKTPPVSLIQPQSQSACAGQSVMFTAQAIGTEPISYQWYSSAGIISGGMDDTLIMNNLTTAQGTTYYAAYTNECGVSASLPATLTINSPVNYTAQSSGTTACPGQTATFSVTATGTSPYTHQWYKKNTTPNQVTVGSGTLTNTGTTYPAPYGNWYWGARHQFIIPASEIIASGGSSGTINSLAFNVATVKGTPLQGFAIKMAATPVDSFASTLFVQNLQTVYTVSSYTETSGWNVHTFDTPFNWDGVSNVIVEVCFNNTAYTTNAIVYQTATSYSSTLWFRQDAQNVCNFSTGTKAYQRPNIRFGVISSSLIPSATNTILNINGITATDEGDYYCITSNTCGSESSSDMNLSVKSMPQVTTASGNVSMCLGGNATFTVTATGTEPLTYQWYKDATPITGAVSELLSLTNIQSSSAASYTCRVSNACGYVTSTAATLTVLSPASITSQSASSSVCSSSPAIFSVTAAGSLPMSYQWYNSSGAISGATAATYSISTATLAHQGDYYCIASNACDTAQSANISLSVNDVPQITFESGSVSRCVGNSNMFSVNATSSLPVTYAWYKGAIAIGGANSSTYLISPIGSSDAAQYKCRASNTCGYVESNSMTLTVNTPLVFAAQSGNLTQCAGTAANFSVSVTGSTPVGYQWYNSSGAISGALGAGYILSPISTANNGDYYCIASNMCGTLQSSVKTLTVTQSPSITQSPASLSVCSGQSAAFSVTATGTQPLEYEWYKGATKISGATLSSLILNNVTANDAGNYTSVVKNMCGQTTSSIAALTVNSPVAFTAQTGNQSVCNASSATFNVNASGSGTISYQWYKTSGAISGANSPTLNINPVSQSHAGDYYCIAGNMCGTLQSSTMTLAVNLLPAISYESGNASQCEGLSQLFTINATSNLTLSYQWFKNTDTINGAQSNSLMLSQIALSNAAQYKCRVTNACGYVESSNMTLLVNTGVAITAQSGDSVKCAGNNMSFYVAASGSSPVSYQWYNNSGAITGATTSFYSLSNISSSVAGTYYCVVSNQCATVQSTTKTLTLNTAPAISLQPSNVQVCVGQNAGFSVTASGSAPLAYQWFKGLDSIQGAIASTLTLNNVLIGQQGNYYCVVSNVCGSVTSNTVTLSVDAGVSFTAQSGNINVCNASSATFSVTATGSTPITYQWYNVNGAISGASNNIYILNAASPAQAGNYYCIASNNCSSVQTSNMVLTVNDEPDITYESGNADKCEGQSALFSIVASSTLALSYQWYKNATPINSANSSSYMIAFVGTSDAANYKCRVTNTCGYVESNAMSLTVNNPVSFITQSGDSTKCSGSTMQFFVQTTGTAPITYQWYNNNGSILTATNALHTIPLVSPANAGSYYCVAANMCGSSQSTSKNLTVSVPPSISQHPANVQVCTGQSAAFTVTASGTSPLSYQWFRNSQPLTGANQSTLSLNNIQNSQAGVYSCQVSNACGIVNSNTSTLSVDTSVVIVSQTGGLIACTGAAASFGITASGTMPISYQWYNNNGAILNATNNTYLINSVTATDAGDYYCVVSNVCASVQSAVKTLTVNTSPLVTVQPANVQSCTGQSAILTLTASGSQPLTYQWYKNANPITGAVNNLYLINASALVDSGLYYCRVSNACGFINSNTVTLSVRTPISLITQSSDSIRCQGGQMTFSVSASGTSPISYQWFKNGSPLAGATSSSYLLTGLQTSHSGFYQAQLTNVCGTVSSTYKNLSVNLNPVVAIGNDTTVCMGNTVLLSPGPGYACQWSNGSLNPQLLVTSSGAYFVNVTDANGCKGISNTVNITVSQPFAQEQVCVVTVEPAVNKNVVVWEKTLNAGIAQYKVYKESTISGVYNLIGIQHVDSMSAWVDIFSNPAVKSERYRISAVDTCGNESAMSPAHKTMHLTVNSGAAGAWNLIWDKYEGFTVPTYRIWRADTTKNWQLIDSVQGTSFTYTDLTPPAGGLYYEVEVIKPGGACIATSAAKASTSYNSSRSNQADNGLITLIQLYTNFFAFPATGNRPLMVQFYDDSDPAVNSWLWDFGDGNTGTMKNPVHIYDTVGVFTVILEASDGTSSNTHTKVAYITVLPVGVEEHEMKPEFTVAPNPITDETQLRFSVFAETEARIEIMDIRGEMVADAIEGRYAPGTYVVPFSSAAASLAPGVYLIRFISKNHSINRKVVIVR